MKSQEDRQIQQVVRSLSAAKKAAVFGGATLILVLAVLGVTSTGTQSAQRHRARRGLEERYYGHAVRPPHRCSGTAQH